MASSDVAGCKRTLTAADSVNTDLRFVRFFHHTTPTHDGVKMARFFEERDLRVMRPVPSLVADGSALVTLFQLEPRSTESPQAVVGLRWVEDESAPDYQLI